jgi:hypothetical protein
MRLLQVFSRSNGRRTPKTGNGPAAIVTMVPPSSEKIEIPLAGDIHRNLRSELDNWLGAFILNCEPGINRRSLMRGPGTIKI